jgi:hypothetical protein
VKKVYFVKEEKSQTVSYSYRNHSFCSHLVSVLMRTGV